MKGLGPQNCGSGEPDEFEHCYLSILCPFQSPKIQHFKTKSWFPPPFLSFLLLASTTWPLCTILVLWHMGTGLPKYLAVFKVELQPLQQTNLVSLPFRPGFPSKKYVWSTMELPVMGTNYLESLWMAVVQVTCSSLFVSLWWLSQTTQANRLSKC